MAEQLVAVNTVCGLPDVVVHLLAASERGAFYFDEACGIGVLDDIGTEGSRKAGLRLCRR